jgi:peptidoglycan hydrolase CwlO-like protein
MTEKIGQFELKIREVTEVNDECKKRMSQLSDKLNELKVRISQ